MTPNTPLSASRINFNQPAPQTPVASTTNPTASPSNLTPKPSDLRPHCSARDRIALWFPHPDSIMTHGPQIPAEARDKVRAVTLHAWADSTKSSYGAGLLVFHVFCDSHNIPERERAPANSALISRFISSLAGYYSGQTIQGYIYGVWAWHTLNSLPWSLHEDHIAAILKGAIKLAPPSTKQDLRQPVTVEIIAAIHSCLTNSPLDKAFYACLTTLFYTAARVGEFTVR